MINKLELNALEEYLKENTEDNPRIARSFLEDALVLLKMIFSINGRIRLIDANELKKQIAGMAIINNYSADRANKMCELIDSQPTAYDVDKVVERLEGALLNLTFHKDYNSKAWNRAIHKAIEIVKSGGIAEERKTEWKEHFASRFSKVE